MRHNLDGIKITKSKQCINIFLLPYTHTNKGYNEESNVKIREERGLIIKKLQVFPLVQKCAFVCFIIF